MLVQDVNRYVFACTPLRRKKTGRPHFRIVSLLLVVLLTTWLPTSAKIHAQQNITYKGSNISIENVFDAIKKQTSYRFFFNTDIIQLAHKITIDVKNASIEQVMSICCNNQPITYTIKGRTIFIMKKMETGKVEQPALSNTSEQVPVSGRITDDKGTPLIGANVKIRGTSIGTTTNVDGQFKLADVPQNAVLEISFIGFETQTVIVRNKSFINIALGQKLSILDETVVIAYGTTSRRFTTGNVATVKAADIEKQPVQNPLLALQGRVPGIEVTQLTGLSGGGVTVRIQGRNSINSGLDPLIVIDGVPFPSQLTGTVDVEGLVQNGSPLNYINPSDIESIDVLKDADATAIYGSRAANGAILITTKKGKSGRTKLSVNLQQGWGKVAEKIKMLNTRQYLDMRYEAYRNDGVVFSSPTVSANDLKVWDTTRYTDWQHVLLGGTALYSNINAGISGGTNTMQYLVGGTFNRQTTVFPGNFDDKKGDLHFNINGSSPNQRFRATMSGSYIYDANHLPGIDLTQKAILLEPDAPSLYNPDGSLNWAPNAAGTSTWTNPLSYTASQDFYNTTQNLISNLGLNYRLFKGLELLGNIGYNNLQAQIYTPTRLSAYAPETRSTATRSAYFGNRNMSSWIMEPQIHYTGTFYKGRIEGMVGTTIQKANQTYLGVYGSGFSTDLLMKTLKAATSTSISQSYTSITRFNALFGRLNYNWDNKYLVSLNARRDGSNKFGDKNRFHNFWSVGLGWIFSEEKWVQYNVPWLSFGKLRTSYGTTGNDQITSFSYLSVYNINNPGIAYQNAIGFNATNIPNPYLQWEETRKSQGGMDLGFMHDRVLLGINYAYNRSTNQLISYVLPSLTGFTSISKNLPAVIQNTSWEFTINTTNVKTKNFTWNSSANLTIPRNKLTSFPGIELTSYASGSAGYIVGQPLGVIKAYHYAGVSPGNGKYQLLDKNGNPTATTSGINDVLISTLPVFYGGFINNISFKRWQLDFLFQFTRKKGKKDMYFYNKSNYPGVFFSSNSNQPVTVLNRWQKPGDNSLIGRFSATAQSLASVEQSDLAYSYDASYIRLKNVSLSWQLPEKLLRKARIQNGQLYFQAQNLITITHYTGLDPETMSSSTLPPLQLWTLGLKLDL